MKYLQKFVIFTFVFITGFTLLTASVSAANDKTKKESAVCRTQVRRATNTLRFYARQESRILLNFDRRVVKLETLSVRFAAEGKDVAALNEDINTVKTMIDGLRADIDDLQAKAEAVKNMTCADANMQQSVSDMKAAELKVRQTRIAINQFIGFQIGSELEALDTDDQS